MRDRARPAAQQHRNPRVHGAVPGVLAGRVGPARRDQRRGLLRVVRPQGAVRPRPRRAQPRAPGRGHRPRPAASAQRGRDGPGDHGNPGGPGGDRRGLRRGVVLAEPGRRVADRGAGGGAHAAHLHPPRRRPGRGVPGRGAPGPRGHDHPGLAVPRAVGHLRVRDRRRGRGHAVLARRQPRLLAGYRVRVPASDQGRLARRGVGRGRRDDRGAGHGLPPGARDHALARCRRGHAAAAHRPVRASRARHHPRLLRRAVELPARGGGPGRAHPPGSVQRSDQRGRRAAEVRPRGRRHGQHHHRAGPVPARAGCAVIKEAPS